MAKSLPPFHALAAFEAVARHQSFSKAAEELSLTRSAISHRITKLEQHLGARCFVRERGLVSLTAQGAQLLGGVLEAMTALEAACARLRKPRRTTIRLSVGPAFARGWLIEKLGGFYRQHGDVDLEIIAAKLTTPGKRAVLKAGEADVAIRYGTAADWSGFYCVRLIESEAFPVCSPAYEKAVGPFSKPSDLVGKALLRLSGQSWVPWFRDAGIMVDEPSEGPLFSDSAIMLDAAANGQGIALARSALVDFDLRIGRLIRLFNVGVTSPCAYHAICAPRAAEQPEIRNFLDWLADAANAGRSPVPPGERSCRAKSASPAAPSGQRNPVDPLK